MRTLKNYGKQDEYGHFFDLQTLVDHSNVFWSDSVRLRLNHIFHDPAAISGRTSTPRRQRFNLDVELYFDIVQVDSITFHLSQCIFDVYQSYYTLEADTLTDLFLNLHFDLCEVERRQMEKSIAQVEDISPEKLLELHELSKERFGRTIEEYFRKTNSGSSLDPLMRYNDELKEITAINNAALFFK